MVSRCFYPILTGILLSSTLSSPLTAQAQTVIAFPRVTGPKPAGRGPTAKGVIAAFEEANLEVLRGEPLRAAAEELGVTVYSLEVAQIADCDYLAIVRLSGKRGAFLAKGQVFRASDGKSVLVLEQSYRSKRGATAAGKAIGTRMAEAILRDRQFSRKRTRPAPTTPSVDPSPTVAEEEEVAREEVALDTSAQDVEESAALGGERESRRPRRFARRESVFGEEPTEPSSTTVVAEPEIRRQNSDSTPERRNFRISIGSGSRLSSSYTVTAGGIETGHSYALDPLLATEASILFVIPSTGLGTDIDFGFTPVQFNVDTDPPANPADPSGQFIDVSGNIFWRLDLFRLGSSGRFSLYPLLSVDYGATLVEEQGDATTVVNAFSTLALGGGARIGLELPPRFGFDADFKLGAITSFSESPAATGADGSGLRIAGRARTRFWIFNQVAAQLTFRYEQRSVGLNGLGDRVGFVGDPELIDADIDIESVDFTAGLVVAI